MTSTRNLTINALYGADNQRRVDANLKDAYENAFDFLGRTLDHIAGPFDGDLELIIVQSPIARPLILSEPSTQCLVYDQALGDTFMTLTNLVLTAPDTAVVDTTLYSVLGQRNLVVGRYQHAALLALLARSDHASKSQSGGSLSAASGDLVEVQELFVMAHELAHLRLDGGSSTSEWQQQYAAIVEQFEPAMPQDPGAQLQLANGFMEEYNSRLITASESRGVSVNQAALMTLDWAESTLAARSSSLDALEDPEFALECLCDAYAISAIWALADSLGFGPETIACGIALGLHNLRWMQTLDYYLFTHRDSQSVAGRQLNDSVSRVALGKSFLRHTAAEAPNAAEADITEKVGALTRTHSLTLADPAMFCTHSNHLLQKASSEQIHVASALSDPANRSVLKALLGFPPDPDRPPEARRAPAP